MKFKVSVIINKFVDKNKLLKTLDAIYSQTYKNIEVLCIYDNYNEIFDDIKRRYEEFKLIEIENGNNTQSKNKAVECCAGEYILFLDCGDIIEKTFIEASLRVLDKDNDVDIVYIKKPINEENGFTYIVLYKRRDFIEAGQFKTYLTNGCEDFDLWITMLEQGLKNYNLKK